MFQENDLIVYGSTGVCRVEKIETPKQASVPGAENLYYRLSPVYSSETIYIPINTSVFMRYVISAEEVNRLIDCIPSLQSGAYHNDNIGQLKEHYMSALRTHDCADLIGLVTSLHEKKQKAEQKGRKFGQIDENFMKRAQELLHGEFAAALGIEKDAVPQYIAARVGRAQGGVS